MDGDEEYEEEFEDDFIQEDEGEDEEEEEEGETQLHGGDDGGFPGAQHEQHNPGNTALTREEGEEEEEEEEEEPIIEDDADDLGEGDEGDDPLEAKIAEEHARFKQAQAQWQEKVRAERPWSAPPLGSPSVQEQRQRTLQTAELQAAVSSRPDAAAVAPRAEYQPPTRPYIEASVARGGKRLSYLAPPRPISADAARSMYRNMGSSSAVQRPGFLQDILEDAPLESPGRASWGARLSTADVDSPIPASPTSAVTEDPELREEATEARVASRSMSGGSGRGDGEGEAEAAGDRGSDGLGSQAGSEVGSEVAPAEEQGEEPGAGEGEGEGEPLTAAEEVAEGARAGVELEMSFGELSKGGLGAEGAEGAEGSADAGEAGDGEGLDEPDDPPQLSRSLSFTLGNQQPSASAVSTPVVFRPMQPLLTFPAVKASPSLDPSGNSPTASEASFAPATPVFGAPATIVVPTILSPPTPSSPGGSPTASPTKPGPASSSRVEESEPPPHEQASGSGAEGDGGAARAGEAGSPAAVAAPQADYGGMMNPHAFALQLLDHDLRTLPAFQEAETAAAPRAPTQSPPRPALAQYGYLGFQGPEPGVGAQGHSQQGTRRTASGQAASSSPSASSPVSVPSALRPSTAPARRSNPGKPKHSAGADEGLLRNSRYPPRPSAAATAAQRAGLARSESVDANGEAGAARAVRIAQALRRPYSAVHIHTTRVVEPQAPAGASSPEAEAELVSGLVPLPGMAQAWDQSHYQPHGAASSSTEAWSSDAWQAQGGDPAPAAAGPSGTAVPGWGRAEVSGMVGGQQGAWASRPGPAGGEGQGRLGQGAGARPSKRGGSDRRPKSAGPTYSGSAGGQFGAAGGLGLLGGAGNVGYLEPGQGRAMLRPHSAQPAMGLRGWEGSAHDAGRVSLAQANGNQTAAVSVGGQAVSVYVADTQRRVVEANRWAAALGVGRRYRLKSLTSNMLVQLVASGSEGGGGPGGGADAARVLKTMTLTQFLVAHGELKAKAAAMAAQGPLQEGGHIRAHRRAMRSSDGADGMPPRDPGRARVGRPWSAAPGAGGSGGGGGMIRPRSGSADYGHVVLEPQAVAARGSFDGTYGSHGARDRQHSIYEVTPSGHVMVESTDPHEHLQRAVAAAQRCQELAQQVNYLRRHSEAWQ